jgi:hypothetical protein
MEILSQWSKVSRQITILLNHRKLRKNQRKRKMMELSWTKAI